MEGIPKIVARIKNFLKSLVFFGKKLCLRSYIRVFMIKESDPIIKATYIFTKLADVALSQL